MLTILVNPQLELLAVIQYLSGSKMVFQGNYADAIEDGSAVQEPSDRAKTAGYTCGFAYDLRWSVLRFEDLGFSRTHLRWPVPRRLKPQAGICYPSWDHG